MILLDNHSERKLVSKVAGNIYIEKIFLLIFNENHVGATFIVKKLLLQKSKVSLAFEALASFVFGNINLNRWLDKLVQNQNFFT